MMARKKVLIVTDDVDMVALAADAILENDELFSASDEQQAMECLQAERPNLVLVDASRPTLDGFEVCRRIRQVGPAAVIMLLDQTRTAADAQRACQLGADDWLTKPFSAKMLGARMRSPLRGAGTT